MAMASFRKEEVCVRLKEKAKNWKDKIYKFVLYIIIV